MAAARKIRLGEKSLDALGPLENDVIKVLWKKQMPMTVREIYVILRKKRKVALTSIAVMLDRLYEKRMVNRKKEAGLGGGHYIYSTNCGKRDFEECVVEKTVNSLIERYGHVAKKYLEKRFANP